jgi:TPP-dependent pyruvate/acetoin dehydrogenase alpha subunit
LDGGVIEPDFVGTAESAADEAIASAIEIAETQSDEPPAAVFDHVFEALPPRLGEQRDELLARQGRPK